MNESSRHAGGVLRHGRRKPINLYWQEGDEPSDDDPEVGVVWVEPIARLVVEAVSALTKVRQLAEAAQQKGAALSSLPTDCSGACMDGECNCSGVWQRHAWKLDPAEVLAALPSVDSPEEP